LAANSASLPQIDGARPEKLSPDAGRAAGLLAGITVPEEDCQVAQIGKRRIVLPLSLDLSAYQGKRIVMLRLGQDYHVREAA
jgi:hypothetical protein